MKAEFYYNKCRYTCSIYKFNSVSELRIKNDREEVLAIEQGKRIGLQGKRRESSREVDVSQPHFYNLIKAAVNALEIAEKNQLLLEKDKVIEVKDEQISILNQQLNILNQTHIPFEQEQEFGQLQDAMKKQVAVIEEQKQLIAKLEDELTHLPQTLPLEEIEKKVRARLGESVWQFLHPSSRKELCHAYRNYQLIKSEEFTGQVADYSVAGLGLGVVAEREIVTPFFKELYNFLHNNNNQSNREASITFEVGGIVVRLNGKYTLGDLPPLISIQWETFIENILEQKGLSSKNELYRTAFGGTYVSQTDRQIIKRFLQQWQHPLSKWLENEQLAASTVDQIRKLRNLVAHSEPMYLWQFKMLWSLLIGRKTSRGVLQEIYGSSNTVQNDFKDRFPALIPSSPAR